MKTNNHPKKSFIILLLSARSIPSAIILILRSSSMILFILAAFCIPVIELGLSLINLPSFTYNPLLSIRLIILRLLKYTKLLDTPGCWVIYGYTQPGLSGKRFFLVQIQIWSFDFGSFFWLFVFDPAPSDPIPLLTWC